MNRRTKCGDECGDGVEFGSIFPLDLEGWIAAEIRNCYAPLLQWMYERYVRISASYVVAHKHIGESHNVIHIGRH